MKKLVILSLLAIASATAMEKPVSTKAGNQITLVGKDGGKVIITHKIAEKIPTIQNLLEVFTAEQEILIEKFDTSTLQGIINIVEQVYNNPQLLALDPVFFDRYSPTDIPAQTKQIVEQNIHDQKSSLMQAADFLELDWIINYNTDGYSIADLVLLNKLPKLTSAHALLLAQKKIISLAGIHIMPEEIRLTIESINLAGNQIKVVPNEAFASLPNLKKLYLVNNQINSINAQMFFGLSKLELLSLVNNKITTIPMHVLTDVPSLKELNLSKNNINSIADYAFAELKALKKLFLYGNKIPQINAHTLAGLESLEVIKLNDNQISSIAENAFHDSRNTLQKIWLERNTIDQATRDRLFQNLPDADIHF